MGRVGTRWIIGVAVSLMWGLAVPAWAEEQRIDHSAWDHLLQGYVSNGRVSYRRLVTERQIIEEYLEYLATIHAERLSKQEQLAFWINAYNAYVMKWVLDRYPLRSVKDVRGFFDNLKCHLAGQDLTLNQVEQRSRALGDVRVHFALVSASVSDPPLRSEAYTGARLDEQLTDQATHFLSDPAHGLRLDGDTLWASMLFKTSAEDFVSGRLTPDALLKALHAYVPAALQAPQTPVRSLKWITDDWALNER